MNESGWARIDTPEQLVAMNRQLTDEAVEETLVVLGNWLLAAGAPAAVITRELEKSERMIREHARQQLHKSMAAMGWPLPV